MTRTKLPAIAAVCLLLFVAGCTGPAGRMSGENIGIEDDKTVVDVDGEQATWTWKGDVNPSTEVEPCDVTLTVSVYDDNATKLAETTTVMRDVESDHRIRSVTIIDDPSVIDRISTYEVTVEDRNCEG